MAVAVFKIDLHLFVEKALYWSQKFEQVCFLQSNSYSDEYSCIESILSVSAKDTFISEGITTFKKLEDFKAKYPNQWMFGFFSYDLKNEIENLQTLHPNRIGFPDAYFFIPAILIKFKDAQIEIEAPDPASIFNEIRSIEIPKKKRTVFKGRIRSRMSKDEYRNVFNRMKSHILRGDIYEVNLCQEFYAEDVKIDPLDIYINLNTISPSPFSSFFKINDKYIISASPERFLAKRKTCLVSQPIKGTAPRGKTVTEDIALRNALQNNPKEIAENVMIVDLVRNDMTMSAEPGTVCTQKKLEIKSYQQVHQLVSTITCIKNAQISTVEAIKNLFPAGSMTGAPKISAMKICDQLEYSRRGLYAGALGYFDPNDDFDFSVVIRTILYNASNKYLSFHTGGAITLAAEVEKEYAECLLKASAILRTLNTDLNEYRRST